MFNTLRRLSKQQKYRAEWTSDKICESYRFLKERSRAILDTHKDKKKYYEQIKPVAY